MSYGFGNDNFISGSIKEMTKLLQNLSKLLGIYPLAPEKFHYKSDYFSKLNLLRGFKTYFKNWEVLNEMMDVSNVMKITNQYWYV